MVRVPTKFMRKDAYFLNGTPGKQTHHITVLSANLLIEGFGMWTEAQTRDPNGNERENNILYSAPPV